LVTTRSSISIVCLQSLCGLTCTVSATSTNKSQNVDRKTLEFTNAYQTMLKNDNVLCWLLLFDTLNLIGYDVTFRCGYSNTLIRSQQYHTYTYI